MQPLDGKRIVLGVTGSIACYKAVELARRLTQAGALVDVVMTDAALRFIQPLTFRAVTHRPVHTDLFDPESEYSINHVGLALEADLVVVAPASAHTLARLALGLADDMLTNTCLATRAPLLVAPAMNTNMYYHPATQEHLKTLEGRGVTLVGPEEGPLAERMSGRGRMSEPEAILEAARGLLLRRSSRPVGTSTGPGQDPSTGSGQDLAGKKIVVTAGGTQEPIDPVRFVGNRSSGKMGYALAQAARDRGATTVLISAPSSLAPPGGVETIPVATAQEMLEAVQRATAACDALIMAAAVADYRPVEAAPQKIKKKESTLTLHLTKTTDILATVKGPFIKVGFAAESQDLLGNARAKLESKGLHLIVANDITATDSGFSADTNRVVILNRQGAEELPLLPKYEVAQRILDRVAALLGERAGTPAHARENG